MVSKIKFLAYYLPQFHQIPENDEWWGEGFTEWTNVKKAKPLFKGHQQPIVPGELGYYDLLKTEGIQEKQAKIAKEHGIDGFIYYQYWFGNGKMLLEKPAEKMLVNKNVDLPFCFCWANETWSGIWHGLTDKILAKQTYPGEEDEERHFAYLLPFFQDERYIKIDEKPLFIIYDIKVPDLKNFILRLRKRAAVAGFKGIYLMASNKCEDDLDYLEMGFDGKISHAFNTQYKRVVPYLSNRFWTKVRNKISLTFGNEYTPILKFDYKKFSEKISYTKLSVETFPIVVPNWDNTARCGKNGITLTNSTPIFFENEISKAVSFLEDTDQTNRIIVVKSWNEWAEGNFLEPNNIHNTGYLKAIKKYSDKI